MTPDLPKVTLISAAAIVVWASTSWLSSLAVEKINNRTTAASHPPVAAPSLPSPTASSAAKTTISSSSASAASTPPVPVLSPDKFFGQAQTGYAAAQKVPDICAKLFCYCGCDLSDNHSSLLDCFTSDHGADCSICQDEAILALKMKNEGKSLADIQKAVDSRFLKEYQQVFSVPSEALLKYRQQREWHPTAPEEAPQSATSDSGAAGKADKVDKGVSPAGAANSAKAKKPGCCGGK